MTSERLPFDWKGRGTFDWKSGFPNPQKKKGRFVPSAQEQGAAHDTKKEEGKPKIPSLKKLNWKKKVEGGNE